MAVPPVTPVEPPVKQPPADQTSLVEPMAAGVGRIRLRAAEPSRSGERARSRVAHDPGPSVGPSGRNLEDIVKELLRPMLKEWLDKNLPTMVERFVEREIVRLTRR